MEGIMYTYPSNYLAHLFREFALVWDVDGICMHYTLLTEVEIVSVLGGFDEPWNSMI
jgi:hypothetical protein